ncbi:hypothetical protein MBLNU459_g8150t1 [Dothideomycetes sp. NU459]
MGSSGSKAARAAGGAARKYPSRPAPPAASPATASTNAPPSRPAPAARGQPGPTVRPRAHASAGRDEAINLDASDPDFAASLRQLGAVQPNPTLSPSSLFPSSPSNQRSASFPSAPDPRKNPAIMVLEARARLQDEAEREFMAAGRRGHGGRRFLDVGVVRQALLMRERGMADADIERHLGLGAGVVGELGAKGIFEPM